MTARVRESLEALVAFVDKMQHDSSSACFEPEGQEPQECQKCVLIQLTDAILVEMDKAPEPAFLPSRDKVQGGLDVLLQIRSWIKLSRIPPIPGLKRPTVQELEGFIAHLYWDYERAAAVDKGEPAPQPSDVMERFKSYRNERCPHVILDYSRWGCDECTVAFVQNEVAAALSRSVKEEAEWWAKRTGFYNLREGTEQARRLADLKGEPAPWKMLGTDALGNGNEHFGEHERNNFCEQRGCKALSRSVKPRTQGR